MSDVDRLKRLEELAERKASVYGRVLTDIALAEEMQGIAKFHQERKSALALLLGEEVEKQGESV